MATSITSLSTLHDHPSVFRIPRTGETPEPPKKNQASILTEEEDPDLSDVDQARENVRTALEGRKYQNLNELLIPGPQAPEYDQGRAKKSKKLAKRAAIVQLIDSLSGIGEQIAYGDSAIVSPVDYSGLGFEALNQLAGLDEQYQIDLRDYNKQRQNINRENHEIRQEAREFNQDVDLELAERDQEQALNEQQDHYEAALRYISQGKFDLASAHLREAGLSPEGVVKKKTPVEVETPPETPSNTEMNVSSPTPDAAPADESEPPKQGSTKKRNPADWNTLETIRTAIEGGLSENPDEATRQMLLQRWREVTRDMLKSNQEVEGNVDWWVDKLYEGLLRELGSSYFDKNTEKEDPGESKGIMSFLKNIIKPGGGKKDQSVDQNDSSGAAEKRALRLVQGAIGNSLSGELDSKTRTELTRRWIENNKRLLQIERPELNEHQRYKLSLEMLPHMLEEKRSEQQSSTPAEESISRPPSQPERNRRSRMEIQDMKSTGKI